MNSHTITITNRNTNQIVESVLDARIPEMMRVRRQYQGLEHDGLYAVVITTQQYDALGSPSA